jgi:hypothetical protein
VYVCKYNIKLLIHGLEVFEVHKYHHPYLTAKGGGAVLKMGQSTTEQAADMDSEHRTHNNTICEAYILRCNVVVRWLVFMLFMWYILSMIL